jgi:hypothetical protein
MNNEKDNVVREIIEKKETKSLIEKQLDTLVPEGERIIKDITGKEYTIPEKLPLGKQIPINRAIATMIRQMPELGGVFAGKLRTDNQLALVASFLESFFSDEAITIIAVLLNKSKSWVENNLDENELIKAIVPFFFQKIGEATRLMTENLAGPKQI